MFKPQQLNIDVAINYFVNKVTTLPTWTDITAIILQYLLMILSPTQ